MTLIKRYQVYKYFKRGKHPSINTYDLEVEFPTLK